MNQPRLPDGFAVQIDRRVKSFASGAALLGGSPRRLLRLSPTAQGMLDNGRLEVRDAASAQLARTLLDATVAHPRPAGGPSHRDVTVVIPVRDNPTGLNRLVSALRSLRVIVVDDGSTVPVQAADFAGTTCEVTVVRREASGGPASARNAGMARCDTEFVAFLDSDVLPRRGWLEALLGHFCDPAVALVAPRIVALTGTGTVIGRYEAVRSALDLGDREALVAPYGPVSYVPSAAIICRRAAVLDVGGFDESMQVGEDVDLCWRLIESGVRLRYEPVALVAHDHRTGWREWLARRVFYGTSAAPLALRHPDKTSAIVMSVWSMLAWLLLAMQSWAGVLAGLVSAGLFTRRVARSVRGPQVQPGSGEVARLALSGLGAAGLQLCSAACRVYWPVTVVAAALSRRCRRALVIAAVVDAVNEWVTRRRCPASESGPLDESSGPPGGPTDALDTSLGPLGYMGLKRLDDLAYGTGVWLGAARERTLAPLKPDLKP